VNVRARIAGMVNQAIDRRHGLPREAATEITLDKEGLSTRDRDAYGPSTWFVLRRMLRPRDVGESDVFVDFGCGMGRIVLQAGRYPFRRVVGVEVAPRFSAIAREAVERGRGSMRCRSIEIVTADVIDYQIPDDLTVAFFANPFHGAVFAAVLRKLIDSVDRRPRTVRVIYNNPVEHRQLIDSGRIRQVKLARSIARPWRRNPYLRLYELLPYEVDDPDGAPEHVPL
jgi:SAM-dependent methyltransferase